MIVINVMVKKWRMIAVSWWTGMVVSKFKQQSADAMTVDNAVDKLYILMIKIVIAKHALGLGSFGVPVCRQDLGCHFILPCISRLRDPHSVIKRESKMVLLTFCRSTMLTNRIINNSRPAMLINILLIASSTNEKIVRSQWLGPGDVGPTDAVAQRSHYAFFGSALGCGASLMEICRMPSLPGVSGARCPRMAMPAKMIDSE